MLAARMPSRVFISYSSKDDSGAEAVLDTVRAALEAAGHEVFVDKEKLEPGDEWRRKIRREIVESHAGVILFTSGALTSDWVWHEASIMSLVKEFSSEFKLIPALLGGVTVQDLKSPRFAPLGLDAFQLTRKSTPAGVAQEIVDALGAVTQPETLLEKVAERIELELSDLSELKLRNVAPKLDAAFQQWKPDGGRRDFTMAIARRVLNEGMDGVHFVIRVLGTILKSGTPALLDVLAPLWVPSEDAALILRIVKRGPRRWCVGINGSYVPRFTAKMFLQRAYWFDERPEIISVAAGTDEDLVGHVRAEMLASVKASRNFGSLDEADAYLRRTGERIFINVPRSVGDKAAIAQLRADYPSATFVLHTGATSPQRDDPSLPEHFEAVPEIDLAEEERAWVRYGDAIGAANNHR